MRNLKDYLYDVMKLELSAYEQGQIISYMEQTAKPKNPSAPEAPENGPYNAGIFLAIIFIFISISCFVVSLSNINDFGYLLIISLMIGTICTGLIISCNNGIKKNNESYEFAKAEYKRQNETCKTTQEKIKKTIDQLKSTLEATRQSLSQLYAEGVIFPKYHSLVPVCSFYEYLSSGRCEALEGEHGAYNLYESELRMNRIVDRLDAIQDSMDQLRTTQYCLYTGLEEVNNQVRIMRETTDKLLDTASYIAATNSITAYCSDVTRRNTELLRKNS